MEECSTSSLISVSMEFAEPQGRGLTAYEVEQCMCPPGYIGTSCEDCAPGYSRTGGGLYLGLCERCECHGHATQCDKEYGFCIDCQHNTEGDQCERCKPGFVGDARRGTPHDCQPAATRPPCQCNNHSPRGCDSFGRCLEYGFCIDCQHNTEGDQCERCKPGFVGDARRGTPHDCQPAGTRPPCQCNNHSPRGCDSFGRCLLCEHSTEGTHCERCKKGFYGDATKGTPYDCTPCPCPGAADCYLDAQGQVACRNCPAGLYGRLCDE
ncbi:laminin EGF-like protein [Oesophagostomum dentatum]|uniref:Laminin EGF-like protein n=1 Tax=Oesophagostomum dentatum TaxID=61180 RepID=A0A0B1T0Y7_OESDE|nr:laminin EGF-like protein [Oesophagostomum dentatum]